MERGMQWIRKLADEADLHGENLPGVPVVELAGNRRVLIEKHKGVSAYSREEISVRVSYGEVTVCGCGLELTLMTREQLVISGLIDQVRMLRRDQP